MFLTITPRRVASILAAILAVLVVLHFACVPARLPGWTVFDLDHETSFGNWFSSFQLVLAAAIGAALAGLNRLQGRPWKLVAASAVVLLLFGIEEVAAVHERLSTDESSALHIGTGATGGTPLMGLALAPFALLGVIGLKHVLSRRPWRWFALGTLVYWVFTFGEEQIESWNDEHRLPSILSRDGWAPLLHGIQESGEMLGVLFVVYALLLELARLRTVVAIRVRGDDVEADPPVPAWPSADREAERAPKELQLEA